VHTIGCDRNPVLALLHLAGDPDGQRCIARHRLIRFRRSRSPAPVDLPAGARP
jgi:hypothetical protein